MVDPAGTLVCTLEKKSDLMIGVPLTVDNNVEMWLEKHSCVSASVEYFAGFSIVTLIFGPNFPDFGQLRPSLVDFGRFSPIQGRIRSHRAKGNHQPPTQLQRLP